MKVLEVHKNHVKIQADDTLDYFLLTGGSWYCLQNQLYYRTGDNLAFCLSSIVQGAKETYAEALDNPYLMYT